MTTPTDIPWEEYAFVLLDPLDGAPDLTTRQIEDVLTLIDERDHSLILMPTHALPLVAYHLASEAALFNCMASLGWYDLLPYYPKKDAILPEPQPVWQYDTCHDTAEGDALHTIEVIGNILDIPDKYDKLDYLAKQDAEYIFDHLDYVMVPLLSERGYVYDNDADMGCVTIWERGDFYLNDYLGWLNAQLNSKEREPQI